jgi:hypothetical protein
MAFGLDEEAKMQEGFEKAEIVTLKCAVVARERALDGCLLVKVRPLELPELTRVELLDADVSPYPDKQFVNLLARPLFEIVWPSRVLEALAYESMVFLGDLCVASEKRLRRHPGVGDKTIGQIHETLKGFDLALGMNLPWWDDTRDGLIASQCT